MERRAQAIILSFEGRLWCWDEALGATGSCGITARLCWQKENTGNLVLHHLSQMGQLQPGDTLSLSQEIIEWFGLEGASFNSKSP